MKVFKFGGACIQNPKAVSNLAQLIEAEQTRPLVVVVSAMGKTTRALENVCQQKLAKQPYGIALQRLCLFHQEIIDHLLLALRKEAHQVLTLWKEQLNEALSVPVANILLDKFYSKIVAEGELLASKLIYYYLKEQNVACTWLDARKFIKTNDRFCNAQVDWIATQNWVEKEVGPLLNKDQVVLTQGFIGSNGAEETTTLGKEGSDFTGAILAAVLAARSLTIWKDVPGIMNADPKLFNKAIKLDYISYHAMAEMAFYGAKVLHPKTIQPLVDHNIPLYVKPFHHPHEVGTEISSGTAQVALPIYILQKNQGLVQLSRAYPTPIDEEYLKEVLHQLTQHEARVRMLVKSESTLSICLDADSYKTTILLAGLRRAFKVRYHEHAALLTVIHQGDTVQDTLLQHKDILLAQQGERIYQAVLQEVKDACDRIDDMLQVRASTTNQNYLKP